MDPSKHKFSNWNGTSGYYERARVMRNAYPTESLLLAEHDRSSEPQGSELSTSYLIKNVTINSYMRERNRSQVVRKLSTTATSNPLSKSAASILKKEHVNIKDWVSRLNASTENQMELWQNAFDEYAQFPENNQKATTLLGSWSFSEKAIHRDNIGRVVRACLGVDVPQFIVDKFEKIGLDKSIERMIIWSDFISVINQVTSLVQSELLKKTETPTLVKLMNKHDIVDKGMGPLGDISTVYRDTMSFNKRPLSNEFARTMPRTTADLLMERTKLDPTATVLSAGTTKGTFQIPGYTGHIPRNKRNDCKVAHSIGATPRPVYENLLLTHTSMGCLAGYTGHVSSYAPEYRDRDVACDPRTSNGAAYGPIRKML